MRENNATATPEETILIKLAVNMSYKYLNLYFFTFVLCLIPMVDQAKASQNLSSQFEGRTFTYAGPNCFGVALSAANVNSIIRGVDVGEFKEVLKLACVKVDSASAGVIGVYSVPNFDIIHAFYFLDPSTVIEKTGVDTVLGKTKVQVRSFDHTYATFGYSKECVFYGGKENPDCYNQLDYYRCDPKLVEMNVALDAIDLQISSRMSLLLNQPKFPSEVSVNQLKELDLLINEFSYQIEFLDEKIKPFAASKLKSFQLQMEYFRLAFNLN